MGADRNRNADLLEFLEEFNDSVSVMKLNRWLGYVQGFSSKEG